MAISRKLLAGLLLSAVIGCSGANTAASSGAGGALLGAWEAPQTYQNEAKVGVSIDGSTVVGLGYTYHFNAIPDQKPNNLQNFFFSKNSVGVAISDFEEIEDSWTLNGVYLVPGSKLQLCAEVGGEASSAWWGSIPDEMAFQFGLQYAIQRNFKVRSRFTTESSASQVDLGAIYVAEFGDQAVMPFLEGVMETASGSGTVGINFGVDYYPMKELSIGVVLADLTEDLNPFLGMVTVISAKYYTGPMAISLGYTILEPVDDVINVGLEYRF